MMPSRKRLAWLIMLTFGLAARQVPAPAVPSRTPTAAPSPRPTLAAEPDTNLGFTFEYGVCYLEVLDTFEQTFRRDVCADPSINIPLALSAGQMRAIYQKLVEIDFLSYPQTFSVPTPENGEIIQVMPTYHYHLTIRNADLAHSVDWQDDIISPTTPAVDRLRTLFQLIIGMVKAHPAYRNLPQPSLGCL